MKKTIKVIVLVMLVFLFGVIADLFYGSISREKLDFVKRFDLRTANKELDKCLQVLPKEEQKIISYADALNCLDPITRKFAQRILAINPKELEFKGPFFSLEPANDLVKIESREFQREDKKIETGINYLPRPVFDDYEKMAAAMKEEIGKTIYVTSGYRSPGYQANLFLFYLGDENQYSLKENAKWIAMPGYSEHNSVNTAIDFINEEGTDGQSKGQTAEDFEKLPEFSWLRNNAAKFNFYLTYPADNPYGVSYEPWHWHWEEK